jgi:hypothetical protein
MPCSGLCSPSFLRIHGRGWLVLEILTSDNTNGVLSFTHFVVQAPAVPTRLSFSPLSLRFYQLQEAF